MFVRYTVFAYVLLICFIFFFFFKQKTAYEMRISDWSSDVCSSDLIVVDVPEQRPEWIPQITLLGRGVDAVEDGVEFRAECGLVGRCQWPDVLSDVATVAVARTDRKSTRLNSSH